MAGVVAARDSVEPEAIAAVERRKIERRCKTTGGTEHHIALARHVISVRVASGGADDQVVETIAVNIAGTADGVA